MAPETISISKPKAPRISLDYSALFKAGIGHIESLSSKLWTDYNSHDPGITTLEILCYAITELSYRCDFPVKDIIAVDPGQVAPPSDFFPLSRIASNAPLTINDFRKLLIDLPGIRNAWLEKADRGETPLHLQLTGAGAPQLLTYVTLGSQEVKIGGLYTVYVQFDEDKDYGDLNDNSMATEVVLDLVTGYTSFEMEVEFPIWEDIDLELDRLVPADVVPAEVQLVPGSFAEDSDEAYTFDFELVINPSGRSINLPLRVRVVSGQEKVLNKDDFKNNLKGQLQGILPPVPNNAATPWVILLIRRFMERRTLIQGLLDDVRESLAEHRNLCEDFLAIYPMSLQEIGLDLELEVEPGSDCELIMAEAYRAMELYLSPVIRFYSLREMLEKGYLPDQIFHGPVLANGFIDDQELSFHQRREILYTSDLIKEFMKISGVKAVRYIALSRFMQGELKKKGATECLKLEQPERFLPRLIYTRSEVRIDEGSGKAKLPDRIKALEILEESKALDQLKGASGQSDFIEPKGTYAGLEAYESIQLEFPINYGIGMEGLAPQEPDLRKAQAQQFKAYLLFFEQILADFLSQLSNVRRLYSFQDDVDRTYFTQALFEVPNVRNLIADFTDAGNTTSWEDYVALALPVNPNHYQVQLDRLAEDEATFYDRRKRFLDHLIGRFNESFTDYAAYIFTRNWSEAEQYSTLIADQVRFLRNYDTHSHDRGTSFNYQILLDGLTGADFWNSDRVTGLKKRMTYLLGLPKVERQYINPFQHFEIYQDGSNKYRYRLRITDDNSSAIMMFGPTAGLNTEEELLEWLEEVLIFSLDATNFVEDSGTWKLKDDTIVLGTVSAAFLSSLGGVGADAVQAIQERLDEFREIENFHIIEHILLRPRSGSGDTLAVRLFNDCKELDIRDPYSFRASVVLPAWSPRFTDIDFRRLFKKLIRLETPAHIYLHFYWIDPQQMYHFENCWADWLNGEWLPSSAFLQQENSDYLLQETSYNILLEQQGDLGEDGIAFVSCMDELKNLLDAYYILEPAHIVDQYKECDLLAYPVDPDGNIIRAWLAPDSGPLPPGTCLNPCNGQIRVEDPSLLIDAEENYPLVIGTISSSGETTYHHIVIQFIANGPAVVEEGYPVNQHIGKYHDGDPVVVFSDPDGNIIQATLISGYGVADTMPPGLIMDPLTGTITVSDENQLIPGSYPLEIKLMDEEGGVTFIQVTIEIKPDTPAGWVVQAPPAKNQDAYQVGDLIFIVFDVDEGILAVSNVLPPTPPFANFGLALSYTGDPRLAEFRISNLPLFQAALTNLFSLNGAGTHYTNTFKILATDNCGGASVVNVPVEIYRDNNPVATPTDARNQDSYVNGDVLANLKDIPDGGLVSVTPVPDLSLLGMAMVMNGTIFEVRVMDTALFKTAVDTEFTNSGAYKIYQFQANTVDNSGGTALVNVLLRVIPDVEPIVFFLAPVKNQDQFFQGEVVATITDGNGQGILTGTQRASDPFTLASAGLSGGTMIGNDGKSKYFVTITNYNAFKGAVSNPAIFVPVPGSPPTDEVEAVFKFDLVDYTGGRGSATVTLRVIRDYDGNFQEEYNGLRVTEYNTTNEVLWRFNSGQPGVNLVNFSSSPDLSTIQGVSWRLAGGEVEIYVDDPSKLVAGLTPLSVTVTDAMSGTDTYAINIEFLPRQVTVTFEITYQTITLYGLDFNSKVPGLVANSIVPGPPPPASFGNISGYWGPGGIAWVFIPGSGFSTTTSTGTWSGKGLISGTEQVDLKVQVKRKLTVVVAGPTTSTVVNNRLTFTGLAGTGSESSATTLVNDSNKVLGNIAMAKNYPDNPLLLSNPKLLGSYAAGNNDSYVVGELMRLTNDTAKEIVRLQGVILETTGKAQANARKDLAAYAEIYRQQVLGAIEYAGQVRDQDIGEKGAVKDLFAAITNQMKGIK